MSASLRDIKERLPFRMMCGETIMISGPPGIGKSAIIHQTAAEREYTIPVNEDVLEAYRSKNLPSPLFELYGKTFTGAPVKDIRLSMCTPTNLMGVPVFNVEENVAVWVQTDLLPMDPNTLAEHERRLVNLISLEDVDNPRIRSKIQSLELKVARGHHEQFSILFMDEITQAVPTIMAAAFQIVLDRRSGTYVIPKDVWMVAAGNRRQDRAGVNELPSPLRSRMGWIELEAPNHKETMEYFLEKGFHKAILGYLEYRQNALYHFDPKAFMASTEAGDSTFPCPRTWEFASNYFNRLETLSDTERKEKFPDHAVQMDMNGIIGRGAASELMAFIKLYHKLPSPLEVLEGRMSFSDMESLFNVGTSSRDQSNGLSLKYAYIISMIDYVFTQNSNYNPETTSPEEIEKIKRWMTNFNQYILARPKDVEWAAITFRRASAQSPHLIILWRSIPSTKDVVAMANAGSVISNSRRPKIGNGG